MALQGVFAAVDRTKHPYDALYSAGEAKDVVWAYVAAAGLEKGAPSRGHVMLDPTLCDALFKARLVFFFSHQPTIKKPLKSSVFSSFIASTKWRVYLG